MFSGPKNSLGSPSPKWFSLLKLLCFPVCLCRYSVVCFILLGWVGPQEFFLPCWQGIYLPWILRVSSRHRGHGWQVSGEQFLWMWMGSLRYMMGEDLQKCPASCTDAVVMVSLQKSNEGGTAISNATLLSFYSELLSSPGKPWRKSP